MDGGDKGASGSLVLADAADDLKKAVDTAYPRSHPEFADGYAVHTCKIVDGVVVYDNVL